MTLNYSFVTPCNPPNGEFYTCTLPVSQPSLTRDAVLEILKADGVPLERVQTLKYRKSPAEGWTTFQDSSQTLQAPPALSMQIFLKPCADPELSQRVSALEGENRELRAQLQDLAGQFAAFKSFSASLNVPQESTLIEEMHRAASAGPPAQRDSFHSASATEIDMAYLYAMPLVSLTEKGSRGRPVALGNPIDAHGEISAIQTELTRLDKRIRLATNIGSIGNVMDAISQRPKIIHISCHGEADVIQQSEDEGVASKSTLHLCLEDNKLNGELDKCSVDDLRHYFRPRRDAAGNLWPRLVFISACYSEEFAAAISEAGVPNVVGINGHTQIADEAAIEFAKIFYALLAKGDTVKEAFLNAKNRVAPTSKKIRLCCCTHQHKRDCKWIEKYMKKDTIDEGHALHVPDCSCDFPICNQHARSCKWVMTINRLLYGDPALAPYGGDKWCCCCPELAHSEVEKFKLWSQKDAENERIFEALPDGKPEFFSPLSGQDIPIVKDTLFGKNKELYSLISHLSPKDTHKVIFVVGQEKSERSLLVKTAARYVIERGGVQGTQRVGFVMIKLINTLCVLSILNSELFPGQTTAGKQIDIAELRRRMQPLWKIVGLRCGDMSEASLTELIEVLKKISQDAPRVKFVVIRKPKPDDRNSPCDNYKDIVIPKIVIPDLDGRSAYNLIKSRYPKLDRSYMDLVCCYKFLDKIKTHRAAKRVIDLLQLGSNLTTINKMFNSEGTNSTSDFPFDRSSAIAASIASTQSDLESVCGSLLPFFLLCQMSSGVFESFFCDFCTDVIRDDYKKRFDEFIETPGCRLSCESSWNWWTAFFKGKRMIRKKQVSALGEYRYKVWKGMREAVRDRCQKQVLAQYQCTCIGKLARIVRQLAQSYNLGEYQRLRHDEFSAFVNDGIWASVRKHQESDSGDSERAIKDPLVHFRYEFKNAKALLDSDTLNSIIECQPRLEEFLDDVRELTVCTVSLLVQMRQQSAQSTEKFFELAYEFANSMLAFAEKAQLGADYARAPEIRKKYGEMAATIKLLKGGMDLDSSRDSASDAYSLFQSLDDKAGVAEALYMIALLDSRVPAKHDLALSEFDSARKHFQISNCEVGVARASVAEAIFYMESSSCQIAGNVVEELLASALKISARYDWLKNLAAESLYQRAKFRERRGLHEAAISDLKDALTNFQEVGNTKTADECACMRNRITSFMQQDKPLLVFLKASPLVDTWRNDIFNGEIYRPLDPTVRDQTLFREKFYDMIRREQKGVKVHFDILTRGNLFDIFLKSCSLMVLSSDHYGTDVMSFEGESGNLECIKLQELRAALENIVYNSQCKVIILSIPNSKAVADMFISLGVPHVVYFRFPDSFYENDRRFDTNQVQYELMDTFALDFCQKLIQGRPLGSAFEDAANVLFSFAEKCGKRFGIKEFESDTKTVPVLINKAAETEQTRNEIILPGLKRSETLEETSPVKTLLPEERPERRKFVGRQEELYRVAMELRNNACVNLYGKKGVGKSRLAEEVATFLRLHSIIPKTLFYRCQTQADDQRLEDRLRAEVKDFRSGDSSRLLIVVDNQTNRQNWTVSLESLSTSNTDDIKMSRTSALASILKSYKCVFLILSPDQVEGGGCLVLSPFKLGRFKEPAESFAFVSSTLETMFAGGRCSLPPEKLLGVEQYDLEDMRKKLLAASGYLKAKTGVPIGRPRQLELFCDGLMKIRRHLSMPRLAKSPSTTRRNKVVYKFGTMTKSQSMDDYASREMRTKSGKPAEDDLNPNLNLGLDLSEEIPQEDNSSMNDSELALDVGADCGMGERQSDEESDESVSEIGDGSTLSQDEDDKDTESEAARTADKSQLEGKKFEPETLRLLRIYGPALEDDTEWDDDSDGEDDWPAAPATAKTQGSTVARKRRRVRNNKRKV